MQHMNDTILPPLPHNQKKISESTAKRWMLKSGFRLRAYKKGVYMDGHERKDVKAYRKVYLDALQAYDE